MCRRLVAWPVRLVIAAGVLSFIVLLFGFIWYSHFAVVQETGQAWQLEDLQLQSMAFSKK